MSAIYKSVVEIFVEQLGVEREKIRPDARFAVDLGLDSLAQVELGMALKRRFAVVVSDAELSRMVTVADVVTALETKGVAVE
jgi:acyl carrier protein